MDFKKAQQLMQTLNESPTLRGVIIGLRLPNILDPMNEGELDDWEQCIEDWDNTGFDISRDKLESYYVFMDDG